MTRTITRSEFVNGAGEGVYVSTVHYASAAERDAGDAACQRVVAPRAFTPFGMAGEAMDPPEYSPQAVNASYTTQAVSGGVTEEPWPSDKDAAWFGPPNCDGNNAGAALAQAQHEAAMDGDECTAGACLLTRGSD